MREQFSPQRKKESTKDAETQSFDFAQEPEERKKEEKGKA
jgi:hypothetical protein